MSKLSVDQQTIKRLLSDNKSDFLIPDYQRPYAWEADKECLTLWEDVFDFALPDNKPDEFNKAEEYYLGPIVTFKNAENEMEIIDGQQRLTTIMLLLRAFYSRFDKMKDDKSIQLQDTIARCIWKTDEFEILDKKEPKIKSEVATAKDNEELLLILGTGEVTDQMKSRYAENYRFFQKQIDEFVQTYPSYFHYLPSRILNNCILLPIEADTQETALRIFSTLNNRGKALSDADIFKAEFYKFYSKNGEKDKFIERWRKLEELCEKIFKNQSGTPMDELFTRYMYYKRAEKRNKKSTTEALRTFYKGNDNYALLRTDETLSNMEILADFWNDVYSQSEERFSQRVLRQLFILNYAPNSMWTFFVSVYFLKNKDAENNVDDEKFYCFLVKMIAFIWCYSVTNPGVNALRTPIYAEMVKIMEEKEVDFANFKFPYEQTINQLQAFRYFRVR